ncbi:hypothetical protein D9M71_216580 [compost metagenome]
MTHPSKKPLTAALREIESLAMSGGVEWSLRAKNKTFSLIQDRTTRLLKVIDQLQDKPSTASEREEPIVVARFTEGVGGNLMSVDQYERVVARLEAKIGGQKVDRCEASEILAGLIKSIEKHGNYSPVATVCFLQQALNCLGPAWQHPLQADGAQDEQVAWRDVRDERRRQVEAEGWTPEHDDEHCAAELPRAAAAYILNGSNDEAPAIWPWAKSWWKPRDVRANYVRAGALILAEIERLDRAAAPQPVGGE